MKSYTTTGVYLYKWSSARGTFTPLPGTPGTFVSTVEMLLALVGTSLNAAVVHSVIFTTKTRGTIGPVLG